MFLHWPDETVRVVTYYTRNQSAIESRRNISFRSNRSDRRCHFSFAAIKTYQGTRERGTTVNIYDSVNAFARNLIYEGPLPRVIHQRALAITSAPGEPANGIFPRFTTVFSPHSLILVIHSFIDEEQAARSDYRRIGIDMYFPRDKRALTPLVRDSRETDVTRGNKTKNGESDEGLMGAAIGFETHFESFRVGAFEKCWRAKQKFLQRR